MTSVLEKVSLFCFEASYAVALLLELLHLLRPRAVHRLVSIGFGIAGFLAHSIFLAVQGLHLSSQYGCLLFLAWILAIFYLYGSLHHRKTAWGVFVLPLLLGLVVMAGAFGRPEGDGSWLPQLGMLHGTLLLLAAVGVCVAFLASVMYLLQAHRLKAKTLPGQGLRLMSLERYEKMNRRAINLAFPLLTAGLLIGAGLMSQEFDQLAGWTDPRVFGTVVLWLVFAILLYLRYGFHLRGRKVALLTIVAFALLLVTLAAPHTLGQGGGR